MSNLQILHKSFLALAGLTFTTILTPQITQATTLVKLSLNQAQLDDPNIRIAELCPEFTCQPDETFFANNVNTPIITLLNNTEFTITGFTLKLLDNQDAIFDQVSSALFLNATLSNNRTEALFAGGILPVNAAATFIINSGADKVAFSAKLSGVPASVPEPNSTLGILAFGTFLTLAVKRQ
jgi:hypothetical protein